LIDYNVEPRTAAVRVYLYIGL